MNFFIRIQYKHKTNIFAKFVLKPQINAQNPKKINIYNFHGKEKL